MTVLTDHPAHRAAPADSRAQCLTRRPTAPVPGQLVAFQARPVRALAMFYDGTIDSQTQLRRWVQRLHPCVGGPEIAADGVVTVTELRCADQIRLSPGQYLVFVQGAACCWSAASPGQVATWLEWRPREMPIFDDGDIAT